MAGPKAMYPTLEAYYAADERRLRRRGRLRRPLAPARLEHRWRVSYVQTTGEIYTVHQGRTIGPVVSGVPVRRMR